MEKQSSTTSPRRSPSPIPQRRRPKPAAPRRASKKKKSTRGATVGKRLWLPIVLVVAAVVLVVGGASAYYLLSSHNGEAVWVHIPRGATEESLSDSLHVRLAPALADRVMTLWHIQGGTPEGSVGAYRVEPGMSALQISRAIAKGRETPVNLSFNGVRTLSQLAGKIAAQVQMTPDEFLAACDTVLPPLGYTGPEQYPAAFIPDTYEVYWGVSPVDLVKRLVKYRDSYWTAERRERASSLGLTPVGVATIASIVEEETAKADERPKVARLYINRLNTGMKLQADPTVKFAIGDFTLRRITEKHLGVNSPYNTYRNAGLPPGPIRVAEKATLEAVLNAPEHDYIYMCAKEDFSGYHNFAVDYATHQANARRYQAELDRRNIK